MSAHLYTYGSGHPEHYYYYYYYSIVVTDSRIDIIAFCARRQTIAYERHKMVLKHSSRYSVWVRVNVSVTLERRSNGDIGFRCFWRMRSTIVFCIRNALESEQMNLRCARACACDGGWIKDLKTASLLRIPSAQGSGNCNIDTVPLPAALCGGDK